MAMQAAIKKASGKQRSNIPPAPPLNLPSMSRSSAPTLSLPCGTRSGIPEAPPLNLPSMSRASIQSAPLQQDSRYTDSRSTSNIGSFGYRDPWSTSLPGEPRLGTPIANSTLSTGLDAPPVSPQRDLPYYQAAEYSTAANESYHSSDMSGRSVASDHTYEGLNTTVPQQSAPSIPRSAGRGRAESFRQEDDISPELPARQLYATGGDVQSPDFTFSSNPFAKPGPCDPYVGSSLVVGLKKGTFKPFIKDVDSAFVLFYDPGNENCLWAKKGIKKAALMVNRPNHVFAAVDCTMECELCEKLNVRSFPTMKLFARGATVNTFDEDTFLSASEMTRFVERTPCFGIKAMGKEQCNVQ